MENIAFGYFDMNKNSHHVFKVMNEDVFLRIYKYSDFNNPVDTVIDKSQSFEEQLLHFLDDSSTHQMILNHQEEDV